MHRIRAPFTLLLLLLVLPVTLAVRFEESAAAPPEASRYIVVLHEGASAPAVANAHALLPEAVYSHALNGFAAAVPEGRLQALQRDPRVAYVEADQQVQLFAQEVPTGISRIFATGNANLDIDGADDYRIDVGVAVIDTGIDYEHPDLDVVFRTDCTGSIFLPSCIDGSGDDGHGHGTHVAGTIGALDNGVGVVGVAPGARLYAVKVLGDNGSGWNSWIIAGIDRVTAMSAQVGVANMSIGGGNSTAVCEAISNSVAEGIVYAVAAGNSDVDARDSSPANCADAITVSALADFDGVAGGVGSATCRADQDDTLADFSNWGSHVEIAAPGVCILSAWKDGGYATISGTSMASPHVAGAAALLVSTSKPANAAQAHAVRQSLIDAGNLGWTDDSGDGIQEPLLDVSNATLFNPAKIATNQPPPPPADTAPSASFVSPADGATVGGAVTIQVDANDAEDAVGTLDVEWRVDGGAWSPAAYNAGSGYYEASWDTTAVANGSHTLETRATDSAPNVSVVDSVTVAVSNVVDPPPGGTVSVASFGYSTEGGRHNDKHLTVTITLVDGQGNPVAGASAGARVDFDQGNNGSVNRSWSFVGTTGSNGSVSFTVKNAPTGGCYATAVTSVQAGGLTWDSGAASNTSGAFCR